MLSWMNHPNSPFWIRIEEITRLQPREQFHSPTNNAQVNSIHTMSTLINENAEARRSLRSFPVVAWLGLQTRVISKAIENELADAKETFTVQAIHTSQLRSTCFSFETFTTLISQLNFVFHYFSSKQAFIFIFFHIVFTKQMFLFSNFFSMLARLFKSCGT